jgi:hypothetical protein
MFQNKSKLFSKRSKIFPNKYKCFRTNDFKQMGIDSIFPEHYELFPKTFIGIFSFKQFFQNILKYLTTFRKVYNIFLDLFETVWIAFSKQIISKHSKLFIIENLSSKQFFQNTLKCFQTFFRKFFVINFSGPIWNVFETFGTF